MPTRLAYARAASGAHRKCAGLHAARTAAGPHPLQQVCDGRDAPDRRDCPEALMATNTDRATAMTTQIERHCWHQKHGRKIGSGRAIIASSKYRKVQLVCPAQNGIVDRAFEYVAIDEARLHVKLLAIWRTHRLQSPV
jgi:hypothetical protein